jgi:hypothetical protein
MSWPLDDQIESVEGLLDPARLERGAEKPADGAALNVEAPEEVQPGGAPAMPAPDISDVDDEGESGDQGSADGEEAGGAPSNQVGADPRPEDENADDNELRGPSPFVFQKRRKGRFGNPYKSFFELFSSSDSEGKPVSLVERMVRGYKFGSFVVQSVQDAYVRWRDSRPPDEMPRGEILESGRRYWTKEEDAVQEARVEKLEAEAEASESPVNAGAPGENAPDEGSGEPALPAGGALTAEARLAAGDAASIADAADQARDRSMELARRGREAGARIAESKGLGRLKTPVAQARGKEGEER